MDAYEHCQQHGPESVFGRSGRDLLGGLQADAQHGLRGGVVAELFVQTPELCRDLG